jgi:hypothetical protein
MGSRIWVDAALTSLLRQMPVIDLAYNIIIVTHTYCSPDTGTFGPRVCCPLSDTVSDWLDMAIRQSIWDRKSR